MEPIFELLFDELPASDYRRFDKGFPDIPS